MGAFFTMWEPFCPYGGIFWACLPISKVSVCAHAWHRRHSYVICCDDHS